MRKNSMMQIFAIMVSTTNFSCKNGCEIASIYVFHSLAKQLLFSKLYFPASSLNTLDCSKFPRIESCCITCFSLNGCFLQTKTCLSTPDSINPHDASFQKSYTSPRYPYISTHEQIQSFQSIY
jgi:hypothetical protein